ncbi:phage portal protein [Eubacterium sp.]|uniref:phage portal protein n=1 Tax=Eubacterium sp. TaxID=142586 RepID=UPI0035216DDA
MRLMDKMRDGIRHFLKIQDAPKQTFSIRELLDHDGNCVKNIIWYRGESYELTQFYQNIPGGADGVKFWAAKSTVGREIRKIHTGLPGIIVDRLTDIVINDFSQISFNKESDKREWNDISKDNNFKEILKDAVNKMLILGDGAFKLSLDESISRYPIIEFYGADKVDYVYNRGRIQEVVFITEYTHNETVYVLKEHYGYGYIRYKLYRETDNIEVPLNTIPILSNLVDMGFDKSLIMAHPIKYGKSPKWEGRGQAIFDKKTDDFDALDEAWSQWMDALRKGRSKEWIPESLIPRNPETGALIKPNAFDNSYMTKGDDMSENSQNKIEVTQPAIPHDSYLATYITALDLCLQGLISPSTLGIDVKKLDNADAQREKEKTTLYTRGNIVDILQDQIPLFIQKVFDVVSISQNNMPTEITCTIDFSEYANPSFESQVETVGKAKTQGIMSVEASVDELYGDTKDEEWKKEEVARLKAEQGITDEEEPALKLEGEMINEGNSGEESLSDVEEQGNEPT